jgi:hypothetical protein
MKKIFILVTMLSYTALAQNLPLTVRHTIQSKIVQVSGTGQTGEGTTIEEGKDLGNVKVEIVKNTGSSMMSTWREFKIFPEKDSWRIEMNAKRFVKKMGEYMDIDTDNSFLSDERNKQATDHYLQFIDQPTQLTLSSSWDTLSLKKPKVTVYSLSNVSLPQLNQVALFSGIFLNPLRFKENSWREKIIQDNTVFSNSFAVQEESADRVKVFISGTQTEIVSLNEVKNESNIPVVGQTITASSSGSDLQYEGYCWVSKTTGFISEIELYVKGTSVMNVMGQTLNKKVNKKYTITNTLASK